MNTILEHLYSGNVFPLELINPNDPEYRGKRKHISNELDQLQQQLSPNDFDRIEKLFSLHCDAESSYSTQNFVYGFKLGALLMIEIFTGKEELVRGGF